MWNAAKRPEALKLGVHRTCPIGKSALSLELKKQLDYPIITSNNLLSSVFGDPLHLLRARTLASKRIVKEESSMKYLVLAFSVLAVRSVMGGAGCPGDGLCSLNGVCTAGACQCDDGWMLGPDEDCSRLDLLPAPSDVSFHGLDENKSSWGGSVLRLPDAAGKPQWSMFAAEMTHDCTLRHWTTNSEVVFAVSETATGPYKEQFQIIPPWAHNPEAGQNPPLTTDNPLENTDAVLRPPLTIVLSGRTPGCLLFMLTRAALMPSMFHRLF